MWIHEHQHWPQLTWDDQWLAAKLASIRHQQGHLLGRMSGLGFDLKQEASLNTLTFDVVKSSLIEGENLDAAEVRSSIAQRLGMDVAGMVPVSRDVAGVVEMMLDATQAYQVPLTADRLFSWHAALFPTGRSGLYQITVGAWRTPASGSMQVVSGAIGKEKVHYEAPAATRLPQEMELFLNWFAKADGLDPVMRAGIAHFWFVTIHPFDDGNGRIARAIGDMALAQADATSDRFYSLSSQIEAERQAYYHHLESQQRATPDITGWLSWFLDCLGRAIERADGMLSQVLFKAQLWDRLNQQSVNERQRSVINRMLDENFEGFMNTGKYASMAKCSKDTALRDIQALQAWGILLQNEGGGRSTSYRLVDAVGLSS
jgi:Fic family protein